MTPTGDGPVRVLVVGGGAAGVIAATTLVREVDRLVDVLVVERGAAIGPGVPYATTDAVHLLNNYAGRMSVWRDDPGHLVRWCLARGLAVSPDSFLPRHVYGRYLADVAAGVQGHPGSRATSLRGEVVRLHRGGAGYVAELAGGGRVLADAVVLALGTPPPRQVPGFRSLGSRHAADPWRADLVDETGPGSRVLLVGSGLTAVDVAVQLTQAHGDVEVLAVSRHRMLPRRHRTSAPVSGDPFPVEGARLADVVREVRRRAARAESRGEDWRSVVESVSSAANSLWAGASPADRTRFVRHVARHWEVARHRMAPAVADVVEGLLLDGRLRVATPDAAAPGGFDLVVSCTGPAPAWTCGWNPLVDDLARKGMLRPDPLALGVDVTPDGLLVGRGGRPARAIHVLGTARRGAEWEVAAVPDLRRQAAVLARHVRTMVPGSAASRDDSWGLVG